MFVRVGKMTVNTMFVESIGYDVAGRPGELVVFIAGYDGPLVYKCDADEAEAIMTLVEGEGGGECC